MTWIVVLLGVAALLLVFSLIKKLLKLAFTALALVLLLVGIWYLKEQNPEFSKSMQQVGGEAVELLERVGGEN